MQVGGLSDSLTSPSSINLSTGPSKPLEPVSELEADVCGQVADKVSQSRELDACINNPNFLIFQLI